jgi:H+/Cl- antiporter ClcA
MNKKQVYAVIGLGAGGYAIYRAVQRMKRAAERYEQRGPAWDVLIAGGIAIFYLSAAFDQAGSAIKKAKRAF